MQLMTSPQDVEVTESVTDIDGVIAFIALAIKSNFRLHLTICLSASFSDRYFFANFSG